jgi:hypothetical protein
MTWDIDGIWADIAAGSAHAAERDVKVFAMSDQAAMIEDTTCNDP